MRKARYTKYLIHEDWKQFKWIKSIKEFAANFPGVQEVYYIEYYNKYNSQYNVTNYDRDRLEKFFREFFEVKKGKHQVVFCWRETDADVLVF